MSNIREGVSPEIIQFAITQDRYINYLKNVAFEFVSRSYPKISINLETGEIKSLVDPGLEKVLKDIKDDIKKRTEQIINNESLAYVK